MPSAGVITPDFLAHRLSLQGKLWQLRGANTRDVLAITQQCGVPDVIARLLASRGVPIEAVEAHLSPMLKHALPNPFLLKDMDAAVSRVLKSLDQDEPVAIFGDYDVDGATSSAILVRFFRMIGKSVDVYIPDRRQEGYGPNLVALRKLHGKGARLVITVDCGTTSVGVLDQMQGEGLDVIVIDHHAAEPRLPKIVALINPNRLDQPPVPSVAGYPVTRHLGDLAAVGVTFLFIVALNKTLRERGAYLSQPEPDLMSLLDLVALGTVCDVMPLTGLNRVFVAQGLKVLGQRKNLGLRALSDVACLEEQPDSSHLGYGLGPRINAGGRVGKSDLGVKLLVTEDPLEARQLAESLDRLNTERREIESAALEEATVMALSLPETSSLVLTHTDWHQGIIGILAGRLKDQFNKPTFVISLHDGVGKGSGRSVLGIDLGSIVHRACHEGLLLNGGGHAMAAGFSIDSKKVDEFTAFFEKMCLEKGGELDMRPQLMCDASLTLQGATEEFLASLQQLAPFGMGNPTPRFVFPFVRIRNVRRVGKSGLHDPLHLRLDLEHDDGSGARLTGIAFRVQGTALAEAFMNESHKLFHIAGTLRLDWWQGRQQVKLYVDDAHYA